jgi:uncharacterized Zn-finger protein
MLNNKEKTFQCSYDGCDKSYYTNSNLQDHINIIHLKQKKYCSYEGCNKSYCNQSKLNRHINNFHLNIKRFKCSECKYSVNNKTHLNTHINSVHLKIKNFECNECKLYFSDNSKLKRHIKYVHLKEKNIKCTYKNCSHVSFTNNDLKKHIKAIHLNERNIKCNYEDCTFKTCFNSELNRHINQVHKKIKRYTCGKCEFEFYSKYQYKKHLNICTGKENISSGEYKCRECLKNMNIEYKHNTTYKVKHKNYLRWDFIIYKNNKVVAFIEYDGKQHFEPRCFYPNATKEDALEELELNKLRDNIKNNFCLDNKYPILRIPYTQYNNTKQLITEFINEQLKYDNI